MGVVPCNLAEVRGLTITAVLVFRGCGGAGLCCGTGANAWDQHVMPERYIIRIK
jgi:hypothetical protein